jgi:signal-transduction protein with cAMP-binding, CBS, and nucleotidyltransferase domain
MTLSVTHLHSPVGDLVIGPAVRVSQDDSITRVAQTMWTNGVSAVLVGFGHSSIVTEHDLAHAVASGCPPDIRIGEVATGSPVSVRSDTDIVEAAGLMLNENVRHLIVELHDGTEGIVSIREIMAALLQAANPDLWLSALTLKVEIPTDAWFG